MSESLSHFALLCCFGMGPVPEADAFADRRNLRGRYCWTDRKNQGLDLRQHRNEQELVLAAMTYQAKRALKELF